MYPYERANVEFAQDRELRPRVADVVGLRVSFQRYENNVASHFFNGRLPGE